MTPSIPRRRAIFTLIVVTVVLAGTVGPAGAETTTAPTPQPLVTEIDLQASLTGDVVVVAGWFEITASAEGRLDTNVQETDFGGTYDVNLAESLGEFGVRGEVVGTVNASRVLFAFEENASSLGWTEAAAPPAVLSATDGGSRNVGIAEAVSPLTRNSGGLTGVESPKIAGPGERMTRHRSPATSVTPLQISPFRRLGISLFDVYWQVATLVLGLVLVGILPKTSRRVADLGVGDPLRTGGAGLAVVLVVPIALLVLGLSLFGIPLAVAGTALYLVFWWVGAVYGRFAVGVWLLGAIPRALATVGVDGQRVENRWAGLLIGTAVVALLVLLPTVGPIIESLVALLGLGGVTRLAYRSYRSIERGNGSRPSVP